ncbi:MAG: hypothetical protein J6D47_10930 [Peptostreptococcaceae bacterium]|nr:hypothetical protein [Peptostreptococcaceae bacterium]
MELDNNSVNVLLRAYQEELARLSNELVILRAEIMLMKSKNEEEQN